MQIKVMVPQDVAIRNGLTECGEKLLEVSSWEGWTDRERETLAGFIHRRGGASASTNGIIVSNYTVEALHVAIQELVRIADLETEKVEREKIERAALEVRLVAQAHDRVAQGEVDWLTYEGSGKTYHESPEVKYTYIQVFPETYLYRDRYAGDSVGASHGTRASHEFPIPDDLVEIAKAHAAKRTEINIAAARQKYVEYQAALRAKEEKEKAQEAEADTLFREFATDEQNRRLAAGFLPETEFDATLRDGLFSPLATWPRYSKLTSDDLSEHDDDCYDSGEITAKVHDAETLESEEFARLEQLQAAVRDVAHFRGWTSTVVPRRHLVTCKACSANVVKTGYLVTVTTEQGNIFTREYE